MEDLSPTIEWNLSKKIAFRFVFIFFILFVSIENVGVFPFGDFIFKYSTELLHKLIPWIGKNVLHLSYNITVFTNGSGDTTYDYVIVFTITVVAILGTIVWSAFSRKQVNYITLYYWLTVIVRFYVGLTLIRYGLVKIVKLQFPSPGITRLTGTYGDSSPMGLAWTFLGFSEGYNLFMGMAEIAAILLLFRRTMTLGAIIALMATSNVMAVNYFYDVPVKILSTALVIMTLFLLLNDAERMIKFFFTGEAVSLPVIKAPAIKKRWLKLTKAGLKLLVIGYTMVFAFIMLYEGRKKYGSQAPKPKLYGLYNVDVFIVNKDTLPPLTTDSARWKQLVIEIEGYALVRRMNDSSIRFYAKSDTVLRKFNFTSRRDSTIKYSFSYTAPEPGKLIMTGVIKEDSVSIYMTRKDVKDFMLMNRGFHWINEYPFSR